MQKVIFFLAGQVPTEDEAAALATLKAGQYEVYVRNGSAAMNYGPRLEDCDFAAGIAVPTDYEESPQYGVPANLPATLTAIGTLPYAIPSVAVGGTIDIGRPDSYTVIDGVFSELNPEGLYYYYSPVNAGVSPGYNGEVSFDGDTSNMTGVIAGTALVGIVIAIGLAEAFDPVSLSLYLPVTVTAP